MHNMQQDAYAKTYNVFGFCNMLGHLEMLGFLNSSCFDGDFISSARGVLKLHQQSFLTERNFALVVSTPRLNVLVDKFFVLPRRCLTRINFEFVIQYEDPVAMTATLGKLCGINSLDDENWYNIQIIRVAYLNLLTNLIIKLSDRGNCNSIILALLDTRHNPHALARACEILELGKILNVTTCAMVASHPNLLDLARLFFDLSCHKITNDNIFAMVALHADIALLDQGCLILSRATMLNDSTVKMVAVHPNPKILAYAFTTLKYAEILNLHTCEMVFVHPHPLELAQVFCDLSFRRITSAEILAIVAAHPNIALLQQVYKILSVAEILYATTCKIIAVHPHPKALAEVFVQLKQDGIVHPATLGIVALYEDPNNFDVSYLARHQSALFIIQVFQMRIAVICCILIVFCLSSRMAFCFDDNNNFLTKALSADHLNVRLTSALALE